MSLNDFFARMREEVRKELKQKQEQARAVAELDEKCRDVLRPYAQQGWSFTQVMAREKCPWTLSDMYEELLQEAEATHKAEAEEHQKACDAAFLAGFQDGYK